MYWKFGKIFLCMDSNSDFLRLNYDKLHTVITLSWKRTDADKKMWFRHNDYLHTPQKNKRPKNFPSPKCQKRTKQTGQSSLNETQFQTLHVNDHFFNFKIRWFFPDRFQNLSAHKRAILGQKISKFWRKSINFWKMTKFKLVGNMFVKTPWKARILKIFLNV